MSQNPALWGLLMEWRELSELEGKAIRNSDWAGVEKCQQRKSGLQSRITQEAGRAESRDKETNLAVSELMALGVRNCEWLAEERLKALEKKRDLETSSRHLRRVRSAYCAPSQPFWNTFS